MAERKEAKGVASITALLSLGLPPDPLRLDFSELVPLIAGISPPPWLAEFLANFTSTLWLDRAVNVKVPTRKLLKKKLDGVQDAAQTLLSALVDNDLWDLVSASDLAGAAQREQLQRQLGLLAAKAEQHAGALTGPTGKVKVGRGHAFSAQTFSPEVYCAVLIAECWRHVRGDYPAPRTKGAQKAADLLWVMVGGNRREHLSDPIASWRPYLTQATRASAPKYLEVFRSDIRRRLADAAHIYVTLTAENSGDTASI